MIYFGKKWGVLVKSGGVFVKSGGVLVKKWRRFDIWFGGIFFEINSNFID